MKSINRKILKRRVRIIIIIIINNVFIGIKVKFMIINEWLIIKSIKLWNFDERIRNDILNIK